MIDWLTIRVCSAYTVQAGFVQSVDADGVVEWRAPKRLPVEGSHSATVTVRESGMFPNLEISGNPAKFMQGHNLFGADDLQGVVSAFVRAVYARLGYEATEAELAAIDAGGVALSRIDVNRNSDFGTSPRALSAVRALAECSHLAHRGRGSLVGEGTCIWGKGSRRWNMKIYAKGLELKKHPIASTVPMLDELLEFAAGVVRQEVTVRSMELKRRGLAFVREWAILGVTPRSLFEELFGLLTISEATMNATKTPHEALPAKLRSVVQLWQDGHDLRELFPTRTFYRHRKALLPLGIDIAVKQPRETSNVVPLVVTLVGREVGVPDWAKGTPLYFDPRASRVA